MDLFKNAAINRFKAPEVDVASAVLASPARDLAVSVPSSSPLAKQLAQQTVTDVALTQKDTFIANVTAGVDAAARAAAIETAGQVWDKATAAKQLAEGL